MDKNRLIFTRREKLADRVTIWAMAVFCVSFWVYFAVAFVDFLVK